MLGVSTFMGYLVRRCESPRCRMNRVQANSRVRVLLMVLCSRPDVPPSLPRRADHGFEGDLGRSNRHLSTNASVTERRPSHLVVVVVWSRWPIKMVDHDHGGNKCWPGLQLQPLKLGPTPNHFDP